MRTASPPCRSPEKAASLIGQRASIVARLAVLASVTTGIVFFWIAVLPHWAAQPAMQAALRQHAEQGINGSATYYTDSPAALTGLQTLHCLQQKQPELFWNF